MRYKHPSWPNYAAVTRNACGSGEVTYVGFMPTDAVIGKIVAEQVVRAGIALPQARYPLIVRGGTLRNGNQVRCFLISNFQAAGAKVELIGRPGSGSKVGSSSRDTASDKLASENPTDLVPGTRIPNEFTSESFSSGSYEKLIVN